MALHSAFLSPLYDPASGEIYHPPGSARRLLKSKPILYIHGPEFNRKMCLIYRSQGHQRYRHRPSPGRHRSVPVADRIHAAQHIRRQRQVQKAHHRGNANFSSHSAFLYSLLLAYPPPGSMFPASVLPWRSARLNTPHRMENKATGGMFFHVARPTLFVNATLDPIAGERKRERERGRNSGVVLPSCKKHGLRALLAQRFCPPDIINRERYRRALLFIN